MSNEDLIRQLQRVTGLYRRGVTAADEANTAASCSDYRGTGRILSKLVRYGDGVTQAVLAEILNIRPQSLSEALSKLEERGWITRMPNPQDKRGTLVYLTEEGREQESLLAERRRCTADALLAPLQQEEKEALSRLLDKILKDN